MKKVRSIKGIKFSPLHLAIYAVILGIVGYIIIRSQAAPPPPTVYINPSTQTLAANTTFTVTVRENSGTTPTNAIQAVFTYPANLLDFVSIDTTGSPFDIGNSLSSSGGSGKVTIGRGAGTNQTGDQLVGTVTFKTKTTSGTAALAFDTGTQLLSATNNTQLLSSLSATGGASVVVDATDPVVGLTAPTNGTTISGGNSVTISGTATDNTQVSSIGIYIDGTLKTTVTGSPFSYSWNTTGVSLGNHTIQAKASDPFGRTGSSALVSVTLADQTAPTVSLTAPTAGAKVAGTIAVSATAADNTGGTGIAKVDFYVDDVLKNSDTAAPYTFQWDTKTASEGTHNIKAIATDLATPANSKTSSVVSVTVENTDRQAPTTPTSFRATAAGLNDITLAWNASTDNVGVTGYRIQRNGTTITTTSALTFKDTGLTAGTGYTYTIVALDAAGNASTVATLSTSTVQRKVGDVDGDNVVGPLDLATLLNNWKTSIASCDFDGSGEVGIVDLSMLLTNYGK